MEFISEVVIHIGTWIGTLDGTSFFLGIVTGVSGGLTWLYLDYNSHGR